MHFHTDYMHLLVLLCKVCLFDRDSGQCTVLKIANKAWHLDLPREMPYTEREI